MPLFRLDERDVEVVEPVDEQRAFVPGRRRPRTPMPFSPLTTLRGRRHQQRQVQVVPVSPRQRLEHLPRQTVLTLVCVLSTSGASPVTVTVSDMLARPIWKFMSTGADVHGDVGPEDVAESLELRGDRISARRQAGDLIAALDVRHHGPNGAGGEIFRGNRHAGKRGAGLIGGEAGDVAGVDLGRAPDGAKQTASTAAAASSRQR